MKTILKLMPLLLLCSFTNLFSITNNNPTLKEVYNELALQDIKHPEVVIRQVIEETGWLDCTGCSLDENNLFGMTKVIYPNGVKKRVFVRYSDWKQSVAAYKRWQLKWYKDETKDYYDFLNCIYTGKGNRCVRYAENLKYTDNLKTLKVDEEFNKFKE